MDPGSSNSERERQSAPGCLLRALAFLPALAALAVVLLFAGRLSYWQAWVWGGINLGFSGVSYLALVKQGDLYQERFWPGPGVKGWDIVLSAWFLPLFGALWAVAGLDGGRFHWTPPWPMGVYGFGYLGFLSSSGLIWWALKTNRFFSSMVRIQKERGHHVVEAGPYRYLRHPGYAGGIGWALSTALVLGSLWALLPAGGIMILLVLRTYGEDRLLQKELPGYAAYTRNVKARLLPGLW